jgi:hypothetical protein
MCPVRLHLKHTSDGQLALEWPNCAHSAHGRALASLMQSCACMRDTAGKDLMQHPRHMQQALGAPALDALPAYEPNKSGFSKRSGCNSSKESHLVAGAATAVAPHRSILKALLVKVPALQNAGVTH